MALTQAFLRGTPGLLEMGAICNCCLVVVAVVALRDMMKERRSEALRHILVACAAIGLFVGAFILAGCFELLTGDCLMVVNRECQGMATGILVFTSMLGFLAYANLFYFFWRLEAHWSTLDDWIGAGAANGEERPLIPTRSVLAGDTGPKAGDPHIGEGRPRSDSGGSVEARAVQPIIFKGKVVLGPAADVVTGAAARG